MDGVFHNIKIQLNCLGWTSISEYPYSSIQFFWIISVTFSQSMRFRITPIPTVLFIYTPIQHYSVCKRTFITEIHIFNSLGSAWIVSVMSSQEFVGLDHHHLALVEFALCRRKFLLFYFSSITIWLASFSNLKYLISTKRLWVWLWVPNVKIISTHLVMPIRSYIWWTLMTFNVSNK